MSLRWPPVRINRTGRPWPSTAMWIFVLSPPGQRPRAGCVAPPFSGRRLCVRPDNAAADHQILVASILNQGLQHPLPDALGRPAGEALVHALAGSVARRQITTPRVTGLAWEQIFDSLPLGLGQFVAAGPRMLGLGHPPKIPDECRFGLGRVIRRAIRQSLPDGWRPGSCEPSCRTAWRWPGTA